MVMQHDVRGVGGRTRSPAGREPAALARLADAPVLVRRPRPLVLPERARLLHVGVPKTGTTMAQGAVAAAPAALAEHGVSVPGSSAAQSRAALSLLGQRVPWMPTGAGPVSGQHWSSFAASVRQAPGRVFASSEYLCEADDDQARRVADELGRDDLHVLVTLRPFGRILPSAWQQYLKSGLTLDYPSWLAAVLADQPTRKVTPSFWRRHDHGRVVRRWAAELGPERVVVLVPGDDRGLILRSLDGLLGLPEGTLTPVGARENRSMSGSEAELFRQVNLRLRRQRLPWSNYGDLLRYGAVLRAVERLGADPADPLPAAPDWAVEAATARGRRYADEIAATGVRVIGDLDDLRRPCRALTVAASAPERAAAVPVDVAAEALVGTLLRAVHGDALHTAPEAPDTTAAACATGGDGRPARRTPTRISATGLAGIPTRQLASELAGRMPGVVGRRTRKALHR